MPTKQDNVKTNINISGKDFGKDKFFLISGPCVIEEASMMMKTAEALKKLSEKLNIPLIFKSSFMKDNRSSLDYYMGPGIEEGLRILQDVKTEFNLPIISDVHFPGQVKAAAEVLDVLQIPAYLCMQSNLVVACAKTGLPINLKHGQFLAPENMIKPVKKIEAQGNDNIFLTERGFTFGYNDLIVDPRSFYYLRETGYPTIFDITHSIRKYGIPSSDPKGGLRHVMPTIARSGVAAGIDGVFIEVHPEPSKALCDAASQLPTKDLEAFLLPLIDLHAVERKYRT